MEMTPPRQAVIEELNWLRGSAGEYSAAKVQRCPNLLALTGEAGVSEGFLRLSDWIDKAVGTPDASMSQRAMAALSIIAPGDNSLRRRQQVAELIYRDERTVRRHADDGIEALADYLLELADLFGKTRIQEVWITTLDKTHGTLECHVVVKDQLRPDASVSPRIEVVQPTGEIEEVASAFGPWISEEHPSHKIELSPNEVARLEGIQESSVFIWFDWLAPPIIRVTDRCQVAMPSFLVFRRVVALRLHRGSATSFSSTLSK
jgi:hypothetical protein